MHAWREGLGNWRGMAVLSICIDKVLYVKALSWVRKKEKRSSCPGYKEPVDSASLLL